MLPLLQFAVGSTIAILMWLFGLHKPPAELDTETVRHDWLSFDNHLFHNHLPVSAATECALCESIVPAVLLKTSHWLLQVFPANAFLL